MNTSQSETIDDGLCLVRQANPEDPASMLFAALDCFAANRLARCAEKTSNLVLCLDYFGAIPPIPLDSLREAVDRFFYYSARGDFLEPRRIDETVTRASLDLLELLLQRDGPLNALCYDILGLIEGVAPITVPLPSRKSLQRLESHYRVDAITHRQFLEAAVFRLAIPAAPIVWELTGCHLRWVLHETPLWAAHERAAGQFQGYPLFEWHRSTGWDDNASAWVFSPKRARPTDKPPTAEHECHFRLLHRDRDDAIYIREDDWRIRSEAHAYWPGTVGQNHQERSLLALRRSVVQSSDRMADTLYHLRRRHVLLHEAAHFPAATHIEKWAAGQSASADRGGWFHKYAAELWTELEVSASHDFVWPSPAWWAKVTDLAPLLDHRRKPETASADDVQRILILRSLMEADTASYLEKWTKRIGDELLRCDDCEKLLKQLRVWAYEALDETHTILESRLRMAAC